MRTSKALRARPRSSTLLAAGLLAALAACAPGLASCRKTPETPPASTGTGGAEAQASASARAADPDAGSDIDDDDPTPVLVAKTVQDFETAIKLDKWPADSPNEPKLSATWKSDGAQSLELAPGLLGLFRTLAVTDWREYTVLRLHVNNTGQRTSALLIELQDDHKEGHERHWNEIGIEPGVHEADFDIAGDLWRGHQDFQYRGEVKTPLDKGNIRSMAVKNKGDAPIYIDQIELLKTTKIDCSGAVAFDFGKENSRVMRQMTGVFDTSMYAPEKGYGFTKALSAGDSRSNSLPTPMLGDGLPFGDSGFRVDLPGGDYIGWIAFERGGFWEGQEAGYDKAALKVNGEVADEHTFSRSGSHFLLEDTEITRPSQMFEKLVWPAHAIRRFHFKAKPGENVFSLDVTNSLPLGLRVAGLVLAPDTPEGRSFLVKHEKLQRRAITKSFAPLDRSRRGGDRQAPAKLALQAMSPGDQMAPGDWPLKDAPPLGPIHAALGQTVAVVMGAYAQATMDATASGEPLKGPDGATLAAPAVSHGRYLLMRNPSEGPVWVEVDHYRPEPTFSMGPDLARSVLFEYEIPRDAKPGVYTGSITVAGGGETAKVPVSIKVAPAVLGAIPIPVCLLKNAPPFGPDVVGQDAWWKLQEAFLKEEGDAGMNCVTGGPGLLYDVDVDGGKYTFSGPAALRYLALAKKYGMDRAVIGYGSFLRSLKKGMMPLAGRVPADPKGYMEGLTAFEKKEKLPPHFVYAYDEPSAEHEREEATSITSAFSQAGGRTLGFTSSFWGNEVWESMVKATYAPTLLKHDATDVKKLKGMGKHPWLYETIPSRFNFGMGLWQAIQVGVEGRLGWVGTLKNGFAFYNLDGRSPSDATFRVHDRLGLMETPRWLATREGLYDLRVRLALEALAPKGDPALKAWNTDVYGFRTGIQSNAELDRSRDAMLTRIEELPRRGGSVKAEK